MHDAHEAARCPDLATENLGAVGAFEQEKIATQHQKLFGRKVEFSSHGVVAEQQAAAVRRIGADRAAGVERHARIGAAFGAVAVHHVRAGLRDSAHHMCHRDGIARSDVAAHGNAGHAEGQRRGKLLQRRVGTRAAGVAVGDHHVVPARDLFVAVDVPEQATDRGAEHVQYAGVTELVRRAVAVDDAKLSAALKVPTQVRSRQGLGVGVVNKR